MKIEIDITEQEVKDLKAIRNYFGEHDKTLFEHKAYAVVDSLVKKLNIPSVIKSLPEPEEIRMKARELDEKDFAQWMYELQKGNVL